MAETTDRIDTLLAYCYRLQAWIRDGIVERCAHREPMRGCTACHHAGEACH